VYATPVAGRPSPRVWAVLVADLLTTLRGDRFLWEIGGGRLRLGMDLRVKKEAADNRVVYRV
jgi:hypothetical protein